MACGRVAPEACAGFGRLHEAATRARRSGNADEAAGVRPDASAPFQCPLTGGALNGRGKAVLHRPTGALVTEKGLKQMPEMARELLLERAQAAMAEGAAWRGSAAQKAGLDAVVAADGRWEERDLLVVNPEGQDAENAADRVRFLTEKVREISHVVFEWPSWRCVQKCAAVALRPACS